MLHVLVSTQQWAPLKSFPVFDDIQINTFYFFPRLPQLHFNQTLKHSICVFYKQIMSVHVAGVRSNILKSNFSENNFSFTPILSCEWNWSEEQIEKRWKISQSIASTCLMKKIAQSTDLHISPQVCSSSVLLVIPLPRGKPHQRVPAPFVDR